MEIDGAHVLERHTQKKKRKKSKERVARQGRGEADKITPGGKREKTRDAAESETEIEGERETDVK